MDYYYYKKSLQVKIQPRDYFFRFVELFDSAQFEEAALLAASSPGGVLRNLDIMEMFEGE